MEAFLNTGRMNRLARVLVALVGTVAMLGWWTDHAALARLLPGIAGMTFNTALCFALLGLALLLPDTRKPQQAVLGGLIAAFAFLSLLQDVFGFDLGLDNLFFSQTAVYPDSPHPGRMSPNTSLAFMMSGMVLLLVSRPLSSGKAVVAQFLLLFTAALSAAGLVMNILFPRAPAGLIHFASMSVFTAISFLLVAIGLWQMYRQRCGQSDEKRSLFFPAIQLMQLLSFSQKFILITLLFLLPLGLSLYEIAANTEREIAAIEKEFTGLDYIKGVVPLFEALPQQRGMRNAWLHGDHAFNQQLVEKEAEIDRLVAAMNVLDSHLGGELRTSSRWQQIRLDWDKIKAETGDASPEQSWARHTELIARLIALMLHAGATSEILVDPHRETHYLMSAFLEELPTGLELLGQARGMGAGVAASGALSVDERFELTYISGRIKLLFEKVEQNFMRAFDQDEDEAEDKSFRIALNDLLKIQQTRMQHFLQLLDNDIIRAESIHIQPMDYFSAGTAAISNGLELFHATAGHFELMLQMQSEQLSGRKYLLQFAAMITLTIVGYLLIAFYLAVMRTVARLDVTTKRMLAGDMQGSLEVDSRDELGQVVSSFNEIATALVGSSSSLKAVVDFAVDGIVTIDETGVVQSFNPAAGKMFGYQEDEVVGRNVRMLMPESWHAAHDTGLSRYVRTGEAGIIGHGVEVEGRRKDGDIFPIDLAVNPMHVGDVRLFLGVIRDITARKQSEMERERLAAAVEQAADSIVITDTKGNIVFVNPAFERLNGYPAQEVLGGNPRILKSGKQGGEFYAQLWQTITSGRVWKAELVNRRKDGSFYDAEHIIVPIRDAGGEIVNFLGVQHDITEHKKAEKKLKDYRDHLEDMVEKRTAELVGVNRELEAFSYSVSHDLRAPLRAIDGFSEALMEDYGGKLDDEGVDYLQRVRTGCQRMGGLIEDLLKLSRVTRYEIKKEDIDLSALAQEVAGRLKEAEPERQASFVIQPGISASCDAHLLRIVLENLLNNAWKYTGKHEQARIEFDCSKEQDELVYAVRDDGAGFDMAYADKLFTAFSRLHSSYEFHGTGVGLATVSRIIARHGGRIWADAEVEKGATFYFTLAPPRKGNTTGGSND